MLICFNSIYFRVSFCCLCPPENGSADEESGRGRFRLVVSLSFFNLLIENKSSLAFDIYRFSDKFRLFHFLFSNILKIFISFIVILQNNFINLLSWYELFMFSNHPLLINLINLLNSTLKNVLFFYFDITHSFFYSQCHVFSKVIM